MIRVFQRFVIRFVDTNVSISGWFELDGLTAFLVTDRVSIKGL